MISNNSQYTIYIKLSPNAQTHKKRDNCLSSSLYLEFLNTHKDYYGYTIYIHLVVADVLVSTSLRLYADFFQWPNLCSKIPFTSWTLTSGTYSCSSKTTTFSRVESTTWG
jgi:hypothetical protein